VTVSGTGAATFASIAGRLAREPEVDEGTAFHSPGLKARGKIFAMLVRGELVVKLPADRCAELVSAGSARPFESGGRRMREWVSVGEVNTPDWASLADEALAFARR
jgi:hypothetical protein